MTIPPETPTTPRSTVWYARPGVVLSLVGILVLFSALRAHAPASARDGDSRLTSYSTEPLGAKMLYELSGKLGLQTERERRAAVPTPATAIFAVLDPVVALRRNEVHDLLEFIRSGGAALIVLGNGTLALSDSLLIRSDEQLGTVVTNDSARATCIAHASMTSFGLWIGSPRLPGLKGTTVDALPDHALARVTRIDSLGKRISPAAVIGYSIGRGRVVVASSPDIFRNDALRECRYAMDLLAVRAIEFLKSDSLHPRDQIVFDEFHQTRPANSGVFGLVRHYLGGTPSGHSVLQLCIAGLLLMLAAGRRTLAPTDTLKPVERRSPLEHVDALARAYQQVAATRTAALRLVSGLRRRAERVGSRAAVSESSEQFLQRVAAVKPALATDVETVRRALGTGVSNAEFNEVGKALERIEAALTRT